MTPPPIEMGSCFAQYNDAPQPPGRIPPEWWPNWSGMGGRIAPEYATLNESAARSLEEGSEETLTLHRLGVPEDLRRRLNTTNLIESLMAQIERKTQRFDHWRNSDQKQRWCAATLLQIEKNFRRIRGLKHLGLLQTALSSKLHPTAA